MPSSGQGINGTGLNAALERIARPHAFQAYGTNTMAKYWAYTNHLLGQVDTTVVADIPAYGAFRNADSGHTLVAYNPTDQEIEANFSGGGVSESLHVQRGPSRASLRATAEARSSNRTRSQFQGLGSTWKRRHRPQALALALRPYHSGDNCATRRAPGCQRMKPTNSRTPAPTLSRTETASAGLCLHSASYLYLPVIAPTSIYLVSAVAPLAWMATKLMRNGLERSKGTGSVRVRAIHPDDHLH